MFCIKYSPSAQTSKQAVAKKLHPKILYAFLALTSNEIRGKLRPEDCKVWTELYESLLFGCFCSVHVN